MSSFLSKHNDPFLRRVARSRSLNTPMVWDDPLVWIFRDFESGVSEEDMEWARTQAKRHISDE